MIRRLLFALLLVLLIAPAVHAQPAAWEVILAATSGGEWTIYRVTPDGVQPPIPVPSGAIYARALTEDLILSPDLRYLVVGQRSDDYTSMFPPRIVDLKLGTIIEVPLPLGVPTSYTLSGFDPTGTRVALSAIYETSGDFSFQGMFGVIDVATGAFTDYTAQITAVDPSTYLPGWYLLGDWGTNGIRFHPTCYACEPPFEGEYAAFDPDTGVLLADTGDAFSLFAEQLPLTGEMFTRAYSQDYPFSTEPMAYFPLANVLVYLPSADFLPTYGTETGEYPISAVAPVIYNQAEVIDLSAAEFEWVLDGQAILAAVGTQWSLINRTGGIQAITPFTYADHLIGTPDGWLAVESLSGRATIRHYTLAGGRVDEHNLGSFDGQTRILSVTPLGETVDPLPAAFTPLVPDFARLEAIMLANQIVCPGFMPSRLFPGQQGRVTPGTPNRMRNMPSTNGEIVGQIPGGATFQILEGPLCGDNTAWWYIEYNGEYGYTAEGVGNEYFTELVRP